MSEHSKDTARALREILARAFRFEYNVGIGPIFKEVYGDNVTEGYLREKGTQIRDQGFLSWYCDLDLDNQNKIVVMMLQRYPELPSLINPWKHTGPSPEPAQPETIAVNLTPEFARAMITLLNSLTSYLQVQADMHAQTRKPNDGSTTMREYCERANNGVATLRDVIKGALDGPESEDHNA